MMRARPSLSSPAAVVGQSTPPDTMPKLSSFVAGARAIRLTVPRWFPLMAGVLLLSALERTAPLRDAVTLEAVTDARLVRPAGYLLLAPLFAIYDALSILSMSQHLTVLGMAATAYAGWRTVAVARRARDVGPPGSPSRRTRRAAGELLLAIAIIAGLGTFYAGGVLAPRPMTALVVDAEDSIIVDFHSHTERSWDSRARFGVTQREAWHAAAGFDAAFVSDHGTFTGALAATHGRRSASEGARPVLLTAAEARYHHQHLVLLGEAVAHEALIASGAVDSAAVRLRHATGEPLPFTILTIPARLEQLPRGSPGTLPIDAIELSVGAPKGIQFAQQHRAALLHLADSLGVPLVAGTNHHGWGRAAPAWNIMTIPGWRELPAEELAGRIVGLLRSEGPAAVRVVERNTREVTGRASAAAAAPAAFWYLLASLTWVERLVFLAWLTVAATASLAWRLRRSLGTRAGASWLEQPSSKA